MAKTFNTPISDWLEMDLDRLSWWVSVADEMNEENRARANVQKVGPGL